MTEITSFKLGHIFHLESARSGGVEQYESGLVPFVTSSEENNGVVEYVEPNEGDKVFNGPAIAVSGLGYATIHLNEFLPKGNGGDSLTVFLPMDEYLVAKMGEAQSKLADIEALPIDEQDKSAISELKLQISGFEVSLSTLPIKGLTTTNLVSICAAFNVLHRWRFSYGRKCSISRLKDLEIPWPLPEISFSWDRAFNDLQEINTSLRSTLQSGDFSEV
jgi:hypothetical protein